MSREYNGYTNYETWVANLWLDNEAGTHDYYLQVARDIYDEAEVPSLGGLGMNKMDDAIYLLADRLKNDHEEAKDRMLEDTNLTSSLWADMLNASLSEVDWRQIAKNLLESAEVEA